MKQNLTGKVVEVAGKIVGLVIQDNGKTLLIRKAALFSNEFVLRESATFFKKEDLVGRYWLRFLDESVAITVPVNSNAATGLVSELLHM